MTRLLLFLTGTFLLFSAGPAQATGCTGSFVNPITDICRDCIFPIGIGPVRVFDDRPDPPNPESFICACPITVPSFVRIGGEVAQVLEGVPGSRGGLAPGFQLFELHRLDLGTVLFAQTAADVEGDRIEAPVTDALRTGNEVRLVGFGTFTIAERAASTGRNPRTGEGISIPASKQPRFKAGKGLKEALNG